MTETKKPGFLKRLGRVFASALSHDHNARSGRRHNNAVLGAEASRYNGHHH